ncbi:HD-GYP domain-containing protein [Pseudobutyrivibrio xylanivorans]|uniref:HDIG domain-containing protein n=1 Tax=Pseudobutyrivibrio xylanivorans DSM 14809 TaxID=1123012 RepID=A0A1M6DQJ7_PSEXY|nr:HD-GYP domain-containing protein [Pseudobutyrivibrio xylanivorans]SHI75526.1 HDIG domain-containing protein [Pseudobutyrivibrio xylanivorans DSM 14809]
MTKEIDGFISDLPTGCITESDIFTDTGALLCPKMTIMDQKMIDSLSHYKGRIHAIVSCEGTSDETSKYNTYINNLKPDEDYSIEFEDSFKQYAVESLSMLYSNLEDVEGLTSGVKELGNKVCEIIDNSKELSINLSKLKVCDEYTYKHSVDVGTMAGVLAKALGESSEFVRDITVAGLLHDIGKEKIPNEVLNKPSRLTDDEFIVIKTHPVHGYNILRDTTSITEEIRQGILNHHENVDGTGYPRGLRGSQIGKMAEIISIVDVYDALVTKRSYKDAKTPAQAIEIMFTMSNKFNKEYFKAFLSIVNIYPNGSTVTLSNGDQAVVLKQNRAYPLRPIIKSITKKLVVDLATNHDYLATVIVA